ncbi:SgcJ/EcaC family oxidoreductase [bacterium]|nr:SgcJ/EcaC family oxidoreductase [bacterium]
MRLLGMAGKTLFWGAIGSCCGLFSLFAVINAAEPADVANQRLAKLQAAIQQMQTAFNAHDAQAMAALWESDAVHRQGTSGDEVKGREAILAAYQDLFQKDPQAKLVITLNQVHEVSAEVVHVKCSTQLMHSDQSVTFSRFSGLLVQQDGKWLIDQVEEFDVAPERVRTPGTLLRQQLGWLIGTWEDDADGSKVISRFQFANGGNFIVREYRTSIPKGPDVSGTQVIGWDNEHKTIRCWQFDGDGSFGEGVWEQMDEKRWRCPMVVKLVDGRRASFTQIIELVSEDQLKWSLVNREVDGLSIPSIGPDQLVRKPE